MDQVQIHTQVHTMELEITIHPVATIVDIPTIATVQARCTVPILTALAWANTANNMDNTANNTGNTANNIRTIHTVVSDLAIESLL